MGSLLWLFVVVPALVIFLVFRAPQCPHCANGRVRVETSIQGYELRCDYCARVM